MTDIESINSGIAALAAEIDRLRKENAVLRSQLGIAADGGIPLTTLDTRVSEVKGNLDFILSTIAKTVDVKPSPPVS